MKDLTNPILLLTKTNRPPGRPQDIRREQLIQMIEQKGPIRLIHVWAPAGYGKTTLLNQLNDTAWVMLDPTDNDFIRFWRYVIHAMSAQLTESSKGGAESLIQAMPGMSNQTVIDAFLNELHRHQKSIRLVLDDYHLIHNEAIHSSLAYFIEYAPTGICVVLASRQQLPFPTVKWEARGECLVLDAVRLQFKPEESAKLLRGHLSLTEEQAAHLHAKAEGWPAGLQLMGLTLKDEPSIQHFLQRFSGYSNKVADYLLEEVLSHIGMEIKSFLLRTSVLQRMDASLCNAIAKRTDSLQILQKLRQEQLFLQPLDAEENWFRYHPLFAEHLQNELRTSQPDEWLKVNRQASALMAERQLYDEALHHAFSAEEYSQAASLLDRHAQGLMAKGEWAAILQWIQRFPEQGTLSSDLLLIQGLILAASGLSEEANQLLNQVENRLRETQCEEESNRLKSGILFVKSNLLFSNGQFQEWFAFTRELNGSELLNNPIFYYFNYNLAQPFARMTPLGLNGVLSEEMEQVGKLFSSVLKANGWGQSWIYLYVLQTLAEGYYEWNRLSEAQELVDTVMKAIRHDPLPGIYVPNRLTQALIYDAQGQRQLALAVLNEATERSLSFSSGYWYDFLLAYRIRLELLEGGLSQTRPLIRQARLPEEETPIYSQLTQYLILTRILAAQGKAVKSLRILEQLKPQALREQSKMVQAAVSIQQCVMCEQMGYRSEALQHLEEALRIGQPFGYIRSFLDEGRTMQALLKIILDGSPNGPSLPSEQEQYVNELLDHFESEQREAPAESIYKPDKQSKLDRQSSIQLQEMSPAEHKLLEMVRQGLSNKQIAEQMSLSEGTIKVYLSRIYNKLGVSSRTQAIAWLDRKE